MRFCERCGAAFQSMRTCPRDRVPTRADLADPLLGRVVGDRYRVLDRIAAGGMGIVYRVAHARIASLFALKVLYGDTAHDPEMRARFQREAEAASCLHSRHIVRVVDFGETPEGLSYLAMEHVDGVSLSDVISRRGQIAEEEAISIARQIARGLAHAHERGIVHRDLKPDNIMMADEDDEEAVAKLLDFGLASARSGGAKLTRAGQIFGTPQYMAPEQFLSTDADGRTDLYALGVILYEMVSGQLPFDAPSLNELAMMHSTRSPPPIAGQNPAVAISPALEGLIARLLAKRVEDRPVSARAVLDALRRMTSVAAGAPVPSRRDTAVPAGVSETIEGAIRAGAPTYNAGDYAGCLGIYRQAANKVLVEVLDPGRMVALGARLRVALTRAAKLPVAADGAWEMRYAFDDLLHAAALPAPVAKNRLAAEIALAQAVAEPRYGAGHLDLVGEYGILVARELAAQVGQEGSNPALHAYLDRVADAAVRAGGGQRALAYLQESLEMLGGSASPTLVSGPARPASAPGLSEGCPDFDRYAQRIVHAIGVGAPVYNAGDIAGCRRIYTHTAEGILAELGASGARLGARLRAAVDEARLLPDDRAAWVLRHAFDEVLSSPPVSAR